MPDTAPRGPSFAATEGNGKGGSTPPPKPPRRRPAAASLEGKLKDFFAGISIMIAATGDHHCAGIIADQTDLLAASYTRLAERNDRVRAFLEALTAGGAYGEAVAVTLATALPIAAHHVPAVRDRLAAFPFMGMTAPPPAPADEPRPGGGTTTAPERPE
jgi:hypothetical protein